MRFWFGIFEMGIKRVAGFCRIWHNDASLKILEDRLVVRIQIHSYRKRNVC